MNKNRGLLGIKWLLVPTLFCSTQVFAEALVEYPPDLQTQAGADHNTAAMVSDVAVSAPTPTMDVQTQAQAVAESDSGFVDDAVSTNDVSMSYVGGNSRIGVGVDSEFKLTIEGSHVVSESADAVTSVEGWLGVDPKADDKKEEEKLKGLGVKVNHNWVNRDAQGSPLKVQKVFGAYDQNETKDKKITVGYGEETKDAFWSVHANGVVSDDRDTKTSDADGNKIYERAYDFGVGARAGTFIPDQLMRVQGGLDLEFGKDYSEAKEERPMQVTASGTVEKYFYDSPHSVAANLAFSKKKGGIEEDKDTNTTGGVTYRYEFGNAGIYQANQKYKRVRVEIPGEIIKKPPRVERKMVKHTMELEGDTFFEKGHAILTPPAEQRLSSIIARIRDGGGQEGNVRITGNTCDLGSEANNYNLSVRRAEAVRQYFINQGFDPNRLLARGLGETNPKYPNEEGIRHRNRRVDLEYMTYETEYKDEVVEAGSETRGEPRVIWRRELVQAPPTWVAQALRNNIQHNRRISTYRTLGKDEVKANNPEQGDTLEANHDSWKLNDHNPVDIAVLSNDFFPISSTVEIVEQPTHGSVTVLSDKQTVRYTPSASKYGVTDTFKYRIVGFKNHTSNTETVTIYYPNMQNTLTAGDDTYPITLGDVTKHALNIFDNDTGEGLEVISVSQPKYGTAEIQPGGQYIDYTLRYGYCEDHSFTYTIRDKYGNTAQAIVMIDVQ